MAKTLFDGGATSKLFLDRRQFYPKPQEVAQMWTDMTPFKTFAMAMNNVKVEDPLYKVFENESTFVKREFTVSTALTVAANGDESAALTVGTITGLASTITSSWVGLVCEIWDVNKTTKRGLVYITEATSTTTFKCKTMKASAITTVSGDYFIVMGRIRGEGSVAWAGESKEISVVWNSTAFLSDSCEVTGDLYTAATLRGFSQDMAFQREEMFKRYSDMHEKSLLTSVSTVGTNFDGSGTFSEASLRTIADPDSVTGSVRTTYGYIPILEDYGVTATTTAGMNADTNIFKLASAGFNYGDLVAINEVIFDKRESDEAFGFSGRGALTKIAQKIADTTAGSMTWKGQVTLADEGRNLNLGFRQIALETIHGIWHLVPTRSLRNQYNNYIAIPDAENIGVAVFKPDEYKNNVKTDNDYDGVKDTIKSKKGLWMQLLKRHHLVIMQ